MVDKKSRQTTNRKAPSANIKKNSRKSPRKSPAFNETPSQMKISTFCLVVLSFATSCSFGEREPTSKEKLEVFQESKFDNNILIDQSQYTNLLNTIFENLDSIIKYDRSNGYSKKIDSIFHLIETEKLVISKENGRTLIRFDINRYKRQNRIIECHFLYWHDDADFKIQDSFDFVKDTALSKNYIYRIGIARDNSGW